MVYDTCHVYILSIVSEILNAVLIAFQLQPNGLGPYNLQCNNINHFVLHIALFLVILSEMKCDVAFTHIHIHTDSPLFQVSIICKAEVLPGPGGGPVGALEDGTTASFVKMAPPISSTRASHGERVAKWRTSIHAFGFLFGVFSLSPPNHIVVKDNVKNNTSRLSFRSWFWLFLSLLHPPLSGLPRSCLSYPFPSPPIFLPIYFPLLEGWLDM